MAIHQARSFETIADAVARRVGDVEIPTLGGPYHAVLGPGRGSERSPRRRVVPNALLGIADGVRLDLAREQRDVDILVAHGRPTPCPAAQWTAHDLHAALAIEHVNRVAIHQRHEQIVRRGAKAWMVWIADANYPSRCPRLGVHRV
jgi:hypothetical protein